MPSASRRAFGSREKLFSCGGPADPLGGTVIDIDRVGVAAAGVPDGATDGDGPLFGRFTRPTAAAERSARACGEGGG